MDEARLSQGIEFLAKQGLNLWAALACADLPGRIARAMLAEEIPLGLGI